MNKKAFENPGAALAVAISLLAALWPATTHAQATIIENDAPGWVYSSRDFVRVDVPQASGGNLQVGWRTGDYGDYVFTGNRVQVFGTKFPQGRNLDIYIDNLDTPLTNVSSYYATTLHQQLIWASDELAEGSHTIRITTRGDWIELDFLRVVVGADVLPGAPASVTAKPDIGQVGLNWPVIRPATVYHIKRAEVSGGPYAIVATVTESSYTDTALTDGTAYYYVVTAENATGEGPASLEVVATPGLQPPPAPTDLTLRAGNQQLTLSWQPAPTATSYNLKRSSSSNGLFTIIASNLTDFVYTDTNVVNGTTYHYVVAGVNAVGEGPNSVGVSGAPTTDVIVEDNDGALLYSSGDFFRWADPGHSGGTVHVGWKVGNSVTYTFEGARIEVYGKKFPGGRTASMYIDGNLVASDVSWHADTDQFRAHIWSSPWYCYGPHTIQMVVGGDWIEFDFFKVLAGESSPLSIRKSEFSEEVEVSWCPGQFILQEASSLSGPWVDVSDITPYYTLIEGNRFFRLRSP